MSTSKANESGERKRKRERKRTREAVTVRQREAGSARFDPGLFAFFSATIDFLFSQFFKPQSWHTGGCNFAQPNYQSVFQFAQFVWSLILCLSSEAI